MDECKIGLYPTIYDCPCKPNKSCYECIKERKSDETSNNCNDNN